MNTKTILQKRFDKLHKHTQALQEYKELIEKLGKRKNIYDPWTFNTLAPQERALFDAYLKRFASIQDFLGAKIFPLLLEIAGIGTSKMSEVLIMIEKEGIIDSLEKWIELREVRNELEHDYPEELQEALNDLKYCIDRYDTIQSYAENAHQFFQKFASCV